MDKLKCLSNLLSGSLVFFSSLVFISTANAALLNQWGTYTLTAGYSCTASPCTGFGDVVEGPADFALQSSFSDITYLDPTRGSAEAHANFSAAIGLNMPALRAQASANSDYGISGIARGVDAYTYTGNSSSRLDLVITLTGTATNPKDADFTNIFSDVYVMNADDAESMFPVGGDSILLQSSLPTIYRASIGLQPDNPIGIVTGVISFDVNPGDSFYLLANLSTFAFDMGSAVSMNSLTMSFTDESDLVAASSAVVPVPAAIWLFGSGLICFTGLALRKPCRQEIIGGRNPV